MAQGRGHRLRKLVAWTALLLLSSLAGGLWFAYVYVTDSVTVARVVRAEAPRYFPGSVVDLTRARLRPFAGEIQFHALVIRQTIDGRPFETARIPWLSLRHNPRAMLEGRFEPTEVVVAQPRLRICRRQDGTWNLQGLLASPWPMKGMHAPPIRIQNGTVELANEPGEGGEPPSTVAILREVSVQVEPAGPGKFHFDGTAKGDSFDRVSVRGVVDVATGRVELAGDLSRLAISDPLRGRLPAEIRPAVDQLGLNGGEIDLTVGEVIYDPNANPRIRYDVSGRLRAGVWNCSRMPFPLNELSGAIAARDGVVTLERLEGFNGTTTVRVDHGQLVLDDPENGPFDLVMEVLDLELDDRLHAWTPPIHQPIWREFSPRGRVSASIAASRAARGGPVTRRIRMECEDVAMRYIHFQYPLDHVRGLLEWRDDQLIVEGLNTVVGGQSLTARGTIDHPGPNAVVALEFAARALPVDQTLLNAMPADVREVVLQFQPTGSVRGTATLRRTPPQRPGDDPIGKVSIDAYLDLNERCGIRWVGLPYPVNNLTGRLEIHPDLWEFKNMRGLNGQAEITGSGKVVKRPGPGNKLDVDLELSATRLPFDDQLRASLPQAWRKSWEILEPTGSSDVTARVNVRHGEPDKIVLVVAPRPATDVRLSYSREPKPGIDPGGTFELRLEDVTGRFVFNNGPVDMRDVGFTFHGSPVQFERGRVIVEDSGKFQLGVNGLWVKDIRLDSGLRKIMPPVMAQFAERFDDGRTFTAKGNLGLGWSGEAGKSVRCAWDNALIVFNDNTVRLQPGLALEHMEGQIDHVRGWADGETFDVHGALRLESVALLGLQMTRLESPIDVERGVARLDSLRGEVLGGELSGKFSVSLDSTPRYGASVALQGADLRRFAETQSGHQSFRGRVNARLDLTGFGGDPRTLQGSGEAHIIDGDLGELPVYLRLVGLLKNFAPASKTAFDAADVALTVQNGRTFLDPIRLTGNAVSLIGKGTMDVQGDLDLRLQVVPGRGRLNWLGLGDALREAGGQFVTVRVQGKPSFPKYNLEPLPLPRDMIKSIGRRERNASATAAPSTSSSSPTPARR